MCVQKVADLTILFASCLSLFTLLFQDECGGLEFLDCKTKEFLLAAPLEGVVYMNIGDMFDHASNGKCALTYVKQSLYAIGGTNCAAIYAGASRLVPIRYPSSDCSKGCRQPFGKRPILDPVFRGYRGRRLGHTARIANCKNG